MSDKDKDPTLGIGNPYHKSESGNIIHFVHVPTMDTCHFKSIITAWDDTFKQDWKSYETVGRMDPIKTYARTSRVISFSIEIPAYNKQEAAFNLLQVQKMVQMSYPTFESVTVGAVPTAKSTADSSATNQAKDAAEAAVLNQQTGASRTKTVSHMVSPPFFKIRFSNWLNDSEKDPSMSNNHATDFKKDETTGRRIDLGSGLYGTIESVKFSPDFSTGFYGGGDLHNTREQMLTARENTLIPATLKLDIVFNVLHTNDLGYIATTGTARSPNFPYNAARIAKKIDVR
jgi:hypothetical protein